MLLGGNGRAFTASALDSVEPDEKPIEIRDPETAGLLLRVEPSGKRSWYLVITRPATGRRTRVRLGAFPALSVQGARKAVSVYVGELAKGIDVAKVRKDARAHAKAEGETKRRERRAVLSAFIESNYKAYADAHQKAGAANVARVRSAFADFLDRPMMDIKPFTIEQWRQRHLKAGRSRAGLNRDLTQLRSVLARAVFAGVLPSHPLKDFKPLRTDGQGRLRFLSNSEEVRLREALARRDADNRAARERFNTHRMARDGESLPLYGIYSDHLTPIVLVALNTGLRRGELLSLRWRAIDTDRDIVTVEGRTAKTLQTRAVPLNSEAVEVLKNWRELQGRVSPDAFVFPAASGGRMDNFATAWESARTAAELKSFRFHDLRHTFASHLVQRGVDLYRVKELLGHSDIKMTARYSHLRPDDLAAAVALLSPPSDANNAAAA